MAKPFEYIQVPLVEVSHDLMGVSCEREGVYWRMVRILSVAGPMTLEEIKKRLGDPIEDIQHTLNWSSTGDQPLLSIRWMEDWRSRANKARDQRSEAGAKSATARKEKASKKKTRSTAVKREKGESPTDVQRPLNERSIILSSDISIENGSGKEHAGEIEYPSDFPECLKCPEGLEAWNDWEQSRKDQKKPISPIARKAQLKLCGQWGKDRAIAALVHSAGGDYQGLFEPKGRPPDPSSHAATLRTASSEKRYTAKL